MKRPQGIAWMMAVFGAVRVMAAPEIVGFEWNGTLVGSNLTAGTTAAVEWASSPAGPWARSWDALAAIPVGPSGVITAAVPFFYRLQDAVPPVVVVTTTTTTTSSTTSTTSAPFAGLEAGDIAIIGYSCDSPDSVHWVNLVDLPAGITIYFSQNGYNAAIPGFSTTENTDNVLYSYPEATPAGTIRADTTWGGLSSDGDNVFVFKDDKLDTTNLLYGLVANGSTTGWGEDVPSSNGTDLPPTLTDGVTAVAIVPEIDNAHFDPTVLPNGGSRAQWLAAIGNRANWIGNDSGPANLTYPTGSIVVTTVDTPTTTSSTSTTTAPPVLPGELAVIRVDAIDESFTVVALRALSEAQTAYWTDNGWHSNNTFRATEGAGTTDIITANHAAGDTFEVATINLNASSEQLFLFRGTVADPTLLYGLQWGSTNGWTADADSASTSANPAVTGGGLTANQTVELGLGARWIYEGPTTGSAAALLSAIADVGHWTTNNAIAWTNGSFSVTVDP